MSRAARGASPTTPATAPCPSPPGTRSTISRGRAGGHSQRHRWGGLYAHAGADWRCLRRQRRQRLPGHSGLLNVAGGGLFDAGDSTICTAPGGTLTASSGTLQNVRREDRGNAQLDLNTGTLGSGPPTALVKTDSGTLVMGGSNTYTGGTIVEAGILVASNGSNGSATGSGSVTLSGGTLASGSGGGSISGEVAIGSLASEIAPGGIGSIGKLTIGSLLAASNLTTLNFDLTTPGGSGDLLVVTGNLTLAPHTAITFGTDPTTYGDYRLIGYGSLTGSLSDFDLPAAPPNTMYSLSTTVDPGYIDLVVAVPEPSTLVLLASAPSGCWTWAWRRKPENRAANATARPVTPAQPASWTSRPSRARRSGLPAAPSRAAILRATCRTGLWPGSP